MNLMMEPKLFRKDFGNKAHKLGGPFKGKGGFTSWGKDGVIK